MRNALNAALADILGHKATFLHMDRDVTPAVVIGFDLYLEDIDAAALIQATNVLSGFVRENMEQNAEISVLPGFVCDYVRGRIQLVIKVLFHQGYFVGNLATTLFEAMGFDNESDWSIGVTLRVNTKGNRTTIRLTTQDTDDTALLSKALRNVAVDQFSIELPHGDMSDLGRHIVEFTFDAKTDLAEAVATMGRILRLHLYVKEPIKPIHA
jgi:hypothetical protein